MCWQGLCVVNASDNSQSRFVSVISMQVATVLLQNRQRCSCEAPQGRVSVDHDVLVLPATRCVLPMNHKSRHGHTAAQERNEWSKPERASSAASECTARIDLSSPSCQSLRAQAKQAYIRRPRLWILAGVVRVFPVYRSIKLVKVIRVPGRSCSWISDSYARP